MGHEPKLSSLNNKIRDSILSHFVDAEVIERPDDIIINFPESQPTEYTFQILISEISNPHLMAKSTGDQTYLFQHEVLHGHQVSEQEISDLVSLLHKLRTLSSRITQNWVWVGKKISCEVCEEGLWRAIGGDVYFGPSLNPLNLFRTTVITHRLDR